MCAWNSGCLGDMQRTLGFILQTTAASSHSHHYSPLERVSFPVSLGPVLRVTLIGYWNILARGIESCWVVGQASVTCLFLNQSFSTGASKSQFEDNLPVFVNNVSLGYSHMRSFGVLSMAVLRLKWQSWMVATETLWLTRSKLFIVWTFTEKKLANPRARGALVLT